MVAFSLNRPHTNLKKRSALHWIRHFILPPSLNLISHVDIEKWLTETTNTHNQAKQTTRKNLQECHSQVLCPLD